MPVTEMNIIRSDLSLIIDDTESAIWVVWGSALTLPKFYAHAASEQTTSGKCSDGLLVG